MWRLERKELEFDNPTLTAIEGHKVYLARVRTNEAQQCVVCPSPVVSRKHCLMEFRNGDWFICDMQSLNGTFVNEQEIEKSDPEVARYEWVKLKDGDIIGLGTGTFPGPDEADRKPEDYFVFTLTKIMPEPAARGPQAQAEEEVIVIASSDEEPPVPVQKTPKKSPGKIDTTVCGGAGRAKPSIEAETPSKPPSVPASPSRPGPLSWKKRLEKSEEKSPIGNKRRVEDALHSAEDRVRKRRKSEEKDEIPSTSKKSPSITPKKPSNQASPASSDRKKTVPTKIRKIASSGESEDDFDERSRAHQNNKSRKIEKADEKTTKSSASKRSRVRGRKSVVYSDEESDSDDVKKDVSPSVSESSDDDLVMHRKKKDRAAAETTSKSAVRSHSIERKHSKMPDPKAKPSRLKLKKTCSVKLRRVVDYTKGKINWDERVQRKLPPRQLCRIEQQLKKKLGVPEEVEKVTKHLVRQGKLTHYEYEETYPERRKASVQKPPQKRLTEHNGVSDSESPDEAPSPSSPEDEEDSSPELFDRESSPEEVNEPAAPTGPRQAILIEPPAGAFTPKRRSKNQVVSFPPEPSRPRGPLVVDAITRKKRLREIALKKKREKEKTDDGPSTSHHVELPKVKVTSKSRNDMLVGTMLHPSPPIDLGQREIPPLPDKTIIQKMPLNTIGGSMKSGGVQPVIAPKVRVSHASRDQQPSMKKLMHKGALSSQEVPGASKAGLERSDSSRPGEKLTEKDRRPPIDLEYPYWEILGWNPKWLEEYKKCKEKTPPISTKQMVSTLHEYVAYDDYVNIFYPLMMSEFWASLFQEISECRPTRHRANGQRKDDDNQKTILFEFKIGVESVELLKDCPLTADQRDRDDPKSLGKPSLGHDEYEWTKVVCHAFSYENQPLDRNRDLGLVTLHFNMPDDRNSAGLPRVVHRKLFCFIYYTSDPIRIDSRTEVHKDLFGALTAEMKQPPQFKTTFHLLVNLTPDERAFIHAQHPGDLKKLMYAGAKLRDFRAVLSLGDSRLFERVLKPSLQYPVFNLGTMKPPPAASLVPAVIKPLNGAQKIIVHNVAKRIIANPEPEVMLLHGPPGTGKTLVIVSLIAQLVKGSSNLGSNLKILVCTPSNTAVDEIIARVEKFFSQHYRDDPKPVMVRLGNEDASKSKIGIDRLAEQRCKQPTALRSIDKSIEDVSSLIKATKQEIDDRKKRGDKSAELQRLNRELEDHKKRLKKHEEDKKKITESGSARPARRDIENEKYKLMREATIIFSTLSSCTGSFAQRCLGRQKRSGTSVTVNPKITVCIVDEATQSTEPESLAPTLLDVNKLFLVGDPCQLPATVISQEAASNNFGDSLFTRHFNYYKKEFKNGPSPVMYLELQYRMHPEVLSWPNKFFYSGRLKTPDSVSQSRRSKLVPYVFINLDGVEVKQSTDGKISNTEEVILILEILKTLSLLKRTQPPAQQEHPWTVGIVTPYREQKKVIWETIKGNVDVAFLKDVEVDTIDSFQGREKDVMILSCVRSQALGFLTSPNRLCVALTRARQSLIVIGNAVCLNSNPMWKELMDDATNRGLFKKISTNLAVKTNDVRFEIERAILRREEQSLLPDDPYDRMVGIGVTSRLPKWIV